MRRYDMFQNCYSMDEIGDLLSGNELSVKSVSRLETQGMLSQACSVKLDDGRLLFVKYLPSDNEFVKELDKSLQLFEREKACYEYMESLCSTLPVPKSIRIKEPSVIAMQHLGAQDFVPCHLKQPLSCGDMEIVLRALADFHFASTVTLPTNELLLKTPPGLEKFFTDALEGGIHDLRKRGSSYIASETVNELESLKGKIINATTSWGRSTTPQVLCNEDMWLPNILMSSSQRVAFVDFQWSHVGHPVEDVVSLLFTSLSATDRRDNWDRLLGVYNVAFCERFGEEVDIFTDDTIADGCLRTILLLIAGDASIFDQTPELQNRCSEGLIDLVRLAKKMS